MFLKSYERIAPLFVNNTDYSVLFYIFLLFSSESFGKIRRLQVKFNTKYLKMEIQVSNRINNQQILFLMNFSHQTLEIYIFHKNGSEAEKHPVSLPFFQYL